jgi:rRNA maturation RNase YbeY
MTNKNNIYFHSQTDFVLKNQLTIQNWIISSIKQEKKLLEEVNVIFCNDESLLEKNKTFLNHDTLTDIITFDYSMSNKISGDVFISVERVLDNSKEFNVTFEQELKRVIIHGFLHLLGYKDKTEKDQKVMREKEDYYLSKIKTND